MNRHKITFPNAEGYELSAVLELPVHRKAGAFAIFAHCFTCSKNLTAVRTIATALTSNGFGVLRFDFTGLGESGGGFADTNFSSNIQDLIAASDYLATNYEAPKLIVGHSLGGAASIYAASMIESIEAVATIGAPASPEHVSHLLTKGIEQIEQEGKAEVSIGGRPFCIKKQFLDDIRAKQMDDVVRGMRKALLIMHSPNDTTVGVENAAKIYQAAMHPKSFVSLDGANHLLTNKADAYYTGDVIGTWAARYIKFPEEVELKTREQVVVQIGREGFTSEVLAAGHRLRADEPKSVGGDDFGPAPYDLLLASLGTCTAMTMRMYADRKKWAAEEIFVHLNHEKETRKDENGKSIKVDKIHRSIEIIGDLDDEQIKRMMNIADKCPVHRTLHGVVEVETELKD